MALGDLRRATLERSCLYLVTDTRTSDDAIRASLSGGVDMVQLRDRELDDQALLARAASLRRICDEHGALLWINDRPDLALEAGADGVHVGQDDLPVDEVRATVGPDLLIGLSTHSPAQLEEAIRSQADQLSVGPVWETPTKPGRRATGLSYVRHAAERAPAKPWFAIGGIDLDRIDAAASAGATRVVVVRAICEADDPAAAAAELRTRLRGSTVGTTQ